MLIIFIYFLFLLLCCFISVTLFFFFFFNDTATTEIYTLSLHDALPILPPRGRPHRPPGRLGGRPLLVRSEEHTSELQSRRDLVCRLLLEKKKKSMSPSRRSTYKKRSAESGSRPSVSLRSAAIACSRWVGSAIVAILFFFFNDTASTEIYTLSLHDALPI